MMNFRRVPLVAGRKIDLARDIIPVAEDRLLQTFFKKGQLIFVQWNVNTPHCVV